MNKIVTDTELMSYIEGSMTKEERKALRKKMEANGDAEVLYHISQAYFKCMSSYADDLLGADDFVVEDSGQMNGSIKMAASKLPQKK